MKNSLTKLYVKMQVLKDALIQDESGQDLVEYALVVSLIALGYCQYVIARDQLQHGVFQSRQ